MENNTQNKFKLTTPVAIIIMGVLIMFGIIISKNPNASLKNQTNNINKQNEEAPKDIPENLNPLSENDHTLGNKETAKILLVTYTDLECPICKSFHLDMKKQMEKYPGEILWVYRQYPIESLHPKAYNEAIASECVAKIGGNNTFWNYLDVLFKNTPSNNGLDPALLQEFAEEVGISKDSFNKCMSEGKEEMSKLVDEDLKNIQEDIGSSGTPYSIIITKDQKIIPMRGYGEAYLDQNLKTVLEK